MSPLSQALSKTSTSGVQDQSKVTDSSKQWASPASGPPNNSSESIKPQTPDNGPNSERKSLAHKSGRKVDESTLETRQNSEREIEPAGPQQRGSSAGVANTTITGHIGSPGPQYELSVGVVDNTTPVERSSTASNADGRATRSASTASEVFSQLSSRPSTNNTSRSSANPTAGNSKTSPAPISSITKSSSSLTSADAKTDTPTIPSIPIPQTNIELAGPSTSTVSAPVAVRSQNSGLSLISYATDVGSTKESLTKKLKLKLLRFKTDARYHDSFGNGNLPRVDGLRQWELSGTAQTKWEGILKPAILETMKNNYTAIYGNQLEKRNPRLECAMIGKTLEQANPLIRITHNKHSVGKKLAKLIEKLDLIKQSGFWITHRETRDFRATWKITILSSLRAQPKTSLIPVCGAELLVASNEKRSTIGAVIDADGRRYGLTVSHVFNEGASDSSDDDDEGIDEGPCSDTEESEEWTSEYDEEEFKACMENEASFPGPPDEPAPTSTSTALPLMLGVEASKGLLWKCQLTNDTGPEWSSMDQQLDYALVELGEYEYRATNGSLSPLRMLDSDGALSTRVSSFPPTPDHDLIVVTRRGSLRAVGRESGSRNEWAIQLKHGEFGEFVCPLTRSLEEVISCLELGDSGSLIVDATDGCVYGILISGDPLFGNGYIAPAIGIKDDLQRTFRANLQYGEEVRNLWPSRQFEVPLLPERYEMLPSKFKVLLDAARAGDFRAISRLIDSDAAQENQKTEQKKPLVEAAKRYKALIPISNVVNATSSTNEARLESPVRQLAEFYRNASRSGFRGEEADLDAKSSFLRILLARGVDPKESADIEGTALHQAAEDGNLELVKVLVTHLEDTTYVNLRRHNCWSPLHLAVREGHDDIVDFLIMNGADIAALNGSEDTKQDTVLQIAAWQGRSSVVRTLLDHKAVSVNDNGRFGGPLRAAAISASRLYHEEMSRIEQNGRGNSSRSSLDEMLVERQARDELFAIAKRSHQPASDASLAKTDPSGTVLSGSAVLQSVSDVLVDFRNLLRSPYQTPYTTILAYGSTIFELLLANEASQTFEGSDKDLEEAFFVAAEEGPSLLVRVLDDVLSKKLSPTLMREKRSKALCLAASAGDLSAIEILTRKGVDLNFKDDDGWTALQLAADAGDIMTVQTLYCPDADVDRRGPGQQTAVTCAAGSLKPDATLILEYLLSKRADAKVKTKRHGNAINLAAKSGNKRAVGILLAAGVSAETRTPRDGTPLEIAANKGYTDIVRLLLKHLDAKDAEDYLREALSSAAVHGSFDTVRTLLAEHDNVQVKEKLLAKVVKSNWVTGGVIDLLRKHLPSKDIQSRLRILLKAAKNQRRPTFPIPLHPYSEDEARPSSIAACLLMHEDDQTLDIPEELAIALAEKSDEATISLLLKKSRNLEITAKLLAAAASNSFHGDAVLSVLLTRCPKLNIHQSTSILKAAVGNQELGVSMLETVLKCMSPDSPQIEDCIFVEAAGNPFHGKELIERLILLLPVDRKLIVTPEIVQTAAQNWSSGDLVLQALLGSTSTTFTRDAVVETVLGFTGSMKDMELDRYEVDVLKMLVKREDVEITPDIRMLVMKRADRKTVEMFEREVPSPAEVSDMDMDRQLVAAASNMEHAPEIINYLLEKKKAITLTERLIDIAAERQEEIEPNIRGNLIMTSLFKSNVTVHLDEFENLLDTVVRDFNFATVEALLSMPNLTLKVTRFTLQAAVLNPHATKELLEMLLEYTGTPEANSDTGSEGRSLEATSEKMEPSLPMPSDNKTESLTITAVLGSSEDIVRTSLELQKVGDITIDPSAETVATQVPCSHAKPLEVKSASETLAPEDLANTLSDSVKPHRDVDSRVDEYVMTSAVSNVERGENLVRVLLGYCDASIITEQVLRAAISNRKQAFEILELLKNHAESDKPPMDSLDASPVTEKSEIPEKVETRASTTFWKPRITRRIFEAAMRNWTETGNNVLLQLLKNDLKAVLTQDMFLEIIRQHKLAVVKELFANHGSSFPMAEDTAEDILSHAAANWSSGVRVFRFVVDENKDLVAKIIPESEKIAEVVAGNWKSGKSVLDLLLRRFKLCVTEKVLLACAKNPYAGADIMKVLLRSYPGQVSTDVLKAAAENFGCGVPLLKLLLKRGEYTCLPDEVFQAACANGSCGHEILDFLADGNYAFNVSESALLACARNASPTRIFLVSPVTEGKEVPMTQDLLHQQREKKKNGNQLLKPPLQYGGIVCLVNMYASRWQECNVLWGLKNGVSEDETWVRREADWVWGTGRGILLDLLENHWIEGDFIPSSILDVAARNFDAEVIRAVLKLRDKPISEVALLNATSNELYAHEVVMTLLAEKRLLPPDSITPPVLISAASNPSCGRQLLGDLWTEKSEVTDALLHAAVGNPSQREQLVAFLLEKGGKVSTELFETAVHNASQGPMIKLLLEHSDDKKLVVTSKTITNAAENEMIGADLVEDFLKLNPAVEISDEALEAAARNRGCGAKVIKLLLTRKPLSEVKELDDILVSAAKNPEQALRLLSMLVDEDPAVRVSPQVWKAAVENPEIAPEVVTFLVNRGTDTRIADEVFLAAIADPDQAVELLALLHKQNGDFDFPQALFHAAIKNWKSGFEILQWSREMQYYFKYDIMSAVELAVQNVGCGIEVLDYLLSNHRPPRSMPVSIWAGAAANLGCGNILIKRLLEYCDKQVDYTDKSVLKAAADNLNWSKQIFMAFSNIPLLSDAPTRIPQEAILSLVNNWKSGADTMSLLKNSPRWSLAITDALLQMIAQNTPDTGGALAVLLEDVDEFDFPELPDAVSPFWLVRSLKAIEFLVTKCKRSSIPQELVRKITGGWGYDAIRKIIGGTEITQEAFHTSATNLLNDGSITRILRLWNSELVVTDDMLQKAVGNNFDLTKTILDMGQGVSSKTLEVAVKQDNTRILKLLLDTVGGTKIADSVLNTAIFNGSPRIVRILLQHGLEDPISEGQLCKAARKDANLEIMQMLLAHRRGETPSKIDIPQSVLDEAVEESCVSMLELLLDNNVAKPFTENTWAKAVEQKNMEIVRILLKHDPNFEVTDHILKCAVKSARVEALKLLLAHYPQIKISQRTMERAAKCKTVEILRLLAGHIQDKESFTITERFVERAAANDNSEVVTFILQQWPDIHITEDAFEGAVKNIDSKVLDLFLEKFPGLSISTRHLVAAASHSSPDRFRKVLELAKERSILPTEEVLGVIIARAGPSLEDVKLVLEANKDCLTESTLQSAFRLDVTDVEAFKFLFQQRQWPLGFIQSEFRTLMRQRPPVAKIKFLLEQQVYDIKVSSTMFVHAADHFDEFAAQALLESTRAKDCALSPDILDTILKGTVAWSSNLPESTRSPWTYTKLDTNVYQKVKVLLDFREVDVTLKNVVQAQSLKGIGRKIIQLFLDSPDKAMMTEDVRKYAASLVVTKDLTFTIKPKAPPALLSADSEDPQEEHTQVSVRSPSIYSDDDSDSVSSYSSSLDRDAHSLDTLSSDSEKRSREVDRPLTYHSLPFQSVKSGVGAGAGAGAAGAEPTWTTVYEVKQQVVPVAGGGFAEWGVCGGLVLQGNDS